MSTIAIKLLQDEIIRIKHDYGIKIRDLQDQMEGEIKDIEQAIGTLIDKHNEEYKTEPEPDHNGSDHKSNVTENGQEQMSEATPDEELIDQKVENEENERNKQEDEQERKEEEATEEQKIEHAYRAVKTGNLAKYARDNDIKYSKVYAWSKQFGDEIEARMEAEEQEEEQEPSKFEKAIEESIERNQTPRTVPVTRLPDPNKPPEGATDREIAIFYRDVKGKLPYDISAILGLSMDEVRELLSEPTG